MIRRIEEISMNACPSLQTILYDGWVLRFANGYTRRANSVNALYPSSREVVEKIQWCEQVYRSRGLPVTFKLTTDCQPEDLDEVLASRGYPAEAVTSVQLANLKEWQEPADPQVELATTLTDEWLAALCRLNAITDRNRATLRQTLENPLPRQCFAALRSEGRIAACGLGVVQDGPLGLFDIVTDPGFRRQGLGRRLVASLLGWGRQAGAVMAYLQVMADNDPAVRLYAGLGFQEAYRYWYRTRP
jgi:GNAT superfamily N-acetyltransferase